jgi:hypothetical protein
MKSLIFVLLLGACRNDAITFAHLLDPVATCHEMKTSWLSLDGDTAVCSATNGEKWFCKSNVRDGVPRCERVAPTAPQIEQTTQSAP